MPRRLSPKWNAEGQPANLAAAAQDGLEWLELWHSRQIVQLNTENLDRLGRCIEALQGFITQRN